MSKIGRPTKYSYSKCVDICRQVAEGGNIIEILKSKDDYPSWPTFCDWKRQYPALQNMYVSSIQDKAEHVDFEIDRLLRDVRNGIVGPKEANVIVQTLKWKAAKYYPKMFGDKSSLDLTTKGESINDISHLTTEELIKRAQAVKALNDSNE